MSLTRSARAERNRILGIYEKAVGETCQMILMSGWNKLPQHQRRHAKAVAQAFEWTTDALRRALAETLPDDVESVPDELRARHER